MILQTLDIKDNCSGIFHQNAFYFDGLQNILDKYETAWKHSPMLDDSKYRYLYLLAKGETLSSYAPDKEAYMEYEGKLRAHQRAAATAKVSMEDTCFFDLLPKHQLLNWFSLKDQALKNLASMHDFESDYDILHKAHVLTTEISKQELLFSGKKGRVLYNIFGSATGRLTTNRESVPILTLKKEQRNLIKPRNDALVELDLNAAEVRTLLALSGHEQPPGDIHEWVSNTVFEGKYTRDQSKVKLFSWLYNFSASDIQLSKFFSRAIFRDFYSYQDQVLKTPFGRKLQVEERKAQNYLLQSTTSDIVIQNAYNIMKMLRGRKSKVAFTLHDSVVIDMSKQDIPILKDIKKQFEQTSWGQFVSTCAIGTHFGNMRELKI